MEINELLKQLNFQPIGETNGRIKRVKGIISNSKPNPEKLFVAEGIWLASMCLKFGTHIDSLIVCPEYVRTPEVAELIKNLCGRTNERFIVSAKTYEKISEKGQPDGIMALAALPQRDIADFIPPKKAVILVIDGVEIPGNAGTMLRMADGAGADAVFFCNRKVRMTHPKLIKSSQGAILTVPVYEFPSVAECRAWLNKFGFTVYLADTRAQRFYYDKHRARRRQRALRHRAGVVFLRLLDDSHSNARQVRQFKCRRRRNGADLRSLHKKQIKKVKYPQKIHNRAIGAAICLNQRHLSPVLHM